MSPARMLELAGKPVLLLDGGDGPPLLYLHGLADVHGAVADWLPFHEALAGSFRVLAPAHPGCATSGGITEVDGVEDLVFHYLDLLDVLEVDRVDLLGVCLGGWIAAELAVRHSQRIRRLVLMDAPGLHVQGAPIEDVFMLSQRRDWGKHSDLRQLLFQDPESALAMAMFPDGAAPLAEELLRYQCLTLAARIGWTPPYLYDRKLRSRLARITAPTLIVWGAGGPLRAPGSRPRLPRGHPRVRAGAPGGGPLALARGARRLRAAGDRVPSDTQVGLLHAPVAQRFSGFALHHEAARLGRLLAGSMGGPC